MSNTLKGKELLAEEEEQDIDYDSLDYNGDPNPPSLREMSELADMDHSSDADGYSRGIPTLGEMQGLAELKVALHKKEQRQQSKIWTEIQKLCWDKLVGDSSNWNEAVGIFYGGMLLMDEGITEDGSQWRDSANVFRDGQSDELYYIVRADDRNIELAEFKTGERSTHQVGRFDFW